MVYSFKPFSSNVTNVKMTKEKGWSATELLNGVLYIDTCLNMAHVKTMTFYINYGEDG